MLWYWWERRIGARRPQPQPCGILLSSLRPASNERLCPTIGWPSLCLRMTQGEWPSEKKRKLCRAARKAAMRRRTTRRQMTSQRSTCRRTTPRWTTRQTMCRRMTRWMTRRTMRRTMRYSKLGLHWHSATKCADFRWCAVPRLTFLIGRYCIPSYFKFSSPLSLRRLATSILWPVFMSYYLRLPSPFRF